MFDFLKKINLDATLSGRHRRAGSGGEPLQNQLRRLLGPTSLPSPIVPQEVRSNNIY